MSAPPGPTAALGEALAGARRAWGYRGSPGLLARKLVRAVRRRRGERAYRAALAGGGVVEVPSTPPAEILFTVATPVHRVAEEHLRAAIASVVAQTHPGWELVLLDDASPDPHVRDVLAEAARADRRIRVARRDTTGGIAVASNEILGMAHGEFVAFLDHDDLLHPRALEIAARRLASEPALDWLFSDEDKIDESGRHHQPCLKPGWSHHLLLSFNYVSHLRVVRRALLDRLGGHRVGFEGAQDYDLALRAVAAGARFGHLPGVLYHWRTVARSMARLPWAKPLAHEHALRALAEHARAWPVGADEVAAEVLLGPASLFRVRRGAARHLSVETIEPAAADPASMIAAARRSSADLVLVPGDGAMSAAAIAELSALLNVPGTAIAAGRGVLGSRVATSGWAVGDDGRAVDPWRGLHVDDPGYLNLALVPVRRNLPPPWGWMGRRELLVDAWDAAPDVAAEWRLAAGLARLGLETVATPAASFRWQGPAPAPPLAPPPPGLPRCLPRWAAELGLA